MRLVSETQPDTGTAPRKVSQRTIVIAVLIAAVVLAAVAVLIFVLSKDDDKAPDTSNFAATSSPAVPPPSSVPGTAAPSGGAAAQTATVQGVAEQVVQAFNAHDPAALKKISCDQQSTELPIPPEAKVELVSAPELTGDTATVQLKLTIGESSTTIPLPLRNQDGSWCAD
ncbi:hypothetical protein [Actinophytocola sp.]|uniref:hypothetical protein n=1 Tax=Actinophytocola sp. TaxID=1872138 RepID=UPI002D80E9D4|nr:hypothetical protein [Actinophytocola sp.]HET9140500.1 hypothetical protein [Actinophytocola sp.]